MWPNWTTAKADFSTSDWLLWGWKITLEKDLVTNSGREPGSSLFLSLLTSFFKAEPFGGCSSPCGVKPLPKLLQLQLPLLLPRHCCPSLLSQELRPPSPEHKVPPAAPRAGGGFGQGRALAGVRRALCAPTAIQQTQPEIAHLLISTGQLQLGRAGPPPAAEEILWKLLPFLNTRNALQWTVNHS